MEPIRLLTLGLILLTMSLLVASPPPLHADEDEREAEEEEAPSRPAAPAVSQEDEQGRVAYRYVFRSTEEGRDWMARGEEAYEDCIPTTRGSLVLDQAPGHFEEARADYCYYFSGNVSIRFEARIQETHASRRKLSLGIRERSGGTHRLTFNQEAVGSGGRHDMINSSNTLEIAGGRTVPCGTFRLNGWFEIRVERDGDTLVVREGRQNELARARVRPGVPITFDFRCEGMRLQIREIEIKGIFEEE